MLNHHHSLTGEGLDAGLLGGSAVALWFLLKDSLAGRPLLTPSLLGQLLILPGHAPTIWPADFGAVVTYTVVHFLAFVVFGLLASWLVRLADLHSMARFALVILFVVFEVAFYVLIQTIADSVGKYFPLFWVLTGNLLATAVMGRYFWQKHPALRRGLIREPLGT